MCAAAIDIGLPRDQQGGDLGLAAARGRDQRGIGSGFTGLRIDAGRFGNDCKTCHSATKWRDAR